MLKIIQMLNSTSKNLKQEIDRMFELEKELAFVN